MRKLGGGFWSPIFGEFSGKLYHFVPIDIGEPLPFTTSERCTYQRVSVIR
jgi:hypothetical protein